MYHVAGWSLDFEHDGREGAIAGYAHTTLVDRSTGATHTDLGLCRLDPGAELGRHAHAFEQCAYVLQGRPCVELGGELWQLEVGDYVLFPLGAIHAWSNPGKQAACWLELGTPQADRGTRWPDTVSYPGGLDKSQARRPPFGDPTLRYLGRYLGTDNQQEALALHDAARGRATAGMDTALLAYSGISVKMMVDAGLGADLCTMFMVDYEPNGAAQVHDHPFEEAYFFLQGEIEGEIEGEVRTFKAGEVLFCGVGVLHGFFNTSAGHVRWIETQAPQPPRRHSYRWPSHWQRLKDGLDVQGA
jgi:quercetin dioxygenase-like cupin family protein